MLEVELVAPPNPEWGGEREPNDSPCGALGISLLTGGTVGHCALLARPHDACISDHGELHQLDMHLERERALTSHPSLDG